MNKQPLLFIPPLTHSTLILVHIYKVIPKTEHWQSIYSLPVSGSLIWMHKCLIMCINSKYMQFWSLVLKTWPVNAIGQLNTFTILLPFVLFLDWLSFTSYTVWFSFLFLWQCHYVIIEKRFCQYCYSYWKDGREEGVLIDLLIQTQIK